MVMTDSVLILTTWPADRDPGALADSLVTSRLAACVTILPMESVYVWQETVHRDREQQLIIKTLRARVDDVWQHVRERHPYDTPEFLVIPIEGGRGDYLGWLARSATS